MVHMDAADLLSHISSFSQSEPSQQGNSAISQSDVQQTLSGTITYDSWQPNEPVPASTSMNAVDNSFASFQPSLRLQNMSYPTTGHCDPRHSGDMSSQTSSTSLLSDVVSRESNSEASTRREGQGSQVTLPKTKRMARVSGASSSVQSAPARSAAGVSANAVPTEAVQAAGWTSSSGNRLKHIEDAIQSFWLVSENRMQHMYQELHSMSMLVKSAHYEQEQTHRHVSQILPLQVQITEKTVRAADERRVIFSRIKALEDTMATQHAQVQETLALIQKELKEGLETIAEQTQKGRKPPPAKSAGNGAAVKNSKGGSPASKKAATSVPSSRKRKQSSSDGNENERASSGDMLQPSTLRPSPPQRPDTAFSDSRISFQVQDPSFARLQPQPCPQSAPASFQSHQQAGGSIEMGLCS